MGAACICGLRSLCWPRLCCAAGLRGDHGPPITLLTSLTLFTHTVYPRPLPWHLQSDDPFSQWPLEAARAIAGTLGVMSPHFFTPLPPHLQSDDPFSQWPLEAARAVAGTLLLPGDDPAELLGPLPSTPAWQVKIIDGGGYCGMRLLPATTPVLQLREGGIGGYCLAGLMRWHPPCNAQ